MIPAVRDHRHAKHRPQQQRRHVNRVHTLLPFFRNSLTGQR
jgi:hypothetical protein